MQFSLNFCFPKNFAFLGHRSKQVRGNVTFKDVTSIYVKKVKKGRNTSELCSGKLKQIAEKVATKYDVMKRINSFVQFQNTYCDSK